MKQFYCGLATCALAMSLTLSAALAKEDNHKHEAKAPVQEFSKVPPKQIEMYLDGFHNYKTDANLPPEKQLQLRVAHFCIHYSPDLIECIIYDTNGSVASKHPRLMGVEYVITDKVYQSLSKEEKSYWHPHDGEVDSGMLRLPGMEANQEKDVLNFVKTTWGKTWHAWNPERRSEAAKTSVVWPELPVGPAKLMWSVSPSDMTVATKKAMVERQKDPAF